MILFLLIPLALGIIFIIFIVGIYNSLVTLRNRFKNAFARQAYNDSVMVYNTAREKFPNVLIAGPFGFKQAELFEIKAPKEREAVKVQF